MSKEGKPELQVIISFNKPDQANSLYKQGWQIESAFKALKSSGFNIEDTHLTEMDRIERLFSLVLIAFVWSYKIGLYLNALKPIPIKKLDMFGGKMKNFGVGLFAGKVWGRRRDLPEFAEKSFSQLWKEKHGEDG